MSTLTVMTFNIHHGVGTDRKLNLDRIADVITESGADIIGLNEVDRCFSKRSGYLDEIVLLSERLKYDFAFSPSITRKNRLSSGTGYYGNGILSRFPIQEVTTHHLDFWSLVAEDRSCLRAIIRTESDKPIHIFVTHLSLNSILQKKQLKMIGNELGDVECALLMGDFNMKSSPNLAQLKDLSRGCKTYPSKQPKVQLDYLFGSHSIRLIEANAFPHLPEASDHLPVVAKVEFPFH